MVKTFFKDVVDKLKQRGFVKADGQDDFEKFLINERWKDLNEEDLFPVPYILNEKDKKLITDIKIPKERWNEIADE